MNLYYQEIEHEKEFFYKMVTLLGEYRDYNLKKMINDSRSPVISNIQNKIQSSSQKQHSNENPAASQIEDTNVEKEDSQNKNKKTLRIISKIPKFIGKELEVYGPFNPDDMASLPKDIADVLIKKGRAEEINVE